VPILSVAWNQLWAGQPRVFEPPPDLIIYNEGTNDGSKDVTAQFVTVVKALQKAAPKAKQLLLLPFNGVCKSVKKVVAQIGSPDVVFGDTSGFYNGENGLHPFGYNHISQIAPKVAELAAPLLMGGKE